MSERTHSYDLYVHQNGRWELHARYALNKRDAALEEAKTLQNIPSIQEVKVVHDVFDTRRGKSSESVIYRSRDGKADTPSPANDVHHNEQYDDFEDGPLPVSLGAAASPRGRRKVKTGVFTKLFILAVASFIISGMVTWVIALAIAELPELRSWIGRSNYGDILFLIFVFGFLLSISTSAYAFLTKEELAGEVHVKEMEDREKKQWAKAMAPPKLTAKQRRALERAAARKLEETNAEFFDGEEDENGPDNLDDVLAASEEDGETPPEEVQLTIGAEKQKVNVMTFLSKGLESVMATRPKLDSFNKFGVNLYLAGACETVGIEEDLNEDEIRQILIDSVGVLGTKPEQAIMFAEKYDEYLMNPKYLGMIESGRSAMTAHVNGDPDAAQKLDKAMDQWNSKKADEETSVGTIAVMFTDIVGSTDMTQTHGDAAAQEVVRTHNRIVRNALTTYQGREVKHTGDGIMASFNNTANGVAAAIYIQQKTVENNSSNPDVPLGIKIGINAGEPIVEDDDLFGTTVQLSARIVDKAGDKEIFVSEIVKGICLGKDFNFESRGAREMKGFKDPITLYEVLWQ
ncbi:MAG: adenylate/guanylate cyclase domain-containing protein [Rhodospirillaceae bacterium]|nr:adenylate/guanylate cyclase domain-containing protein [Rhodospirillaceae bacterium]MBT7955944.1 adenylate/guanylate cyclase domain-containing protein [Rhodospirillaceae bacterium]